MRYKVVEKLKQIEEGITFNERGCHIWGGTLIHGKIPCLSYSHTKKICIARLLWTREHDDFKGYSNYLKKTCGEDKCVNLSHFQLVDKKKEFDRDHSWNLLLKKTTALASMPGSNCTGGRRPRGAGSNCHPFNCKVSRSSQIDMSFNCFLELILNTPSKPDVRRERRSRSKPN